MIFMKNLLEINRTLWAKKTFFCILACSMVVLVLMTACKKKQDPETFLSDKARPTWTTPDKQDMTSSMTAVIKIDLKTQYPVLASDFVLNDNDLIAAYSGETCLGTASPKDGLFFLYVGAPVGVTPSSVTLKYYSAYYKNIFEAKDAFPFVTDGIIGKISKPFVPTLVVVK